MAFDIGSAAPSGKSTNSRGNVMFDRYMASTGSNDRDSENNSQIIKDKQIVMNK